MTLSDLNTLVSKLSATLQSGGAGSSDRDLADQYADACQHTNERLAQCARMIDEGSSVQALMLAEEKPNLLDAVAVLSFGKSGEWRDACAVNGFRQPAKLDQSAVHKLNELYNKGNRTEQTKALYKEFRAAMAARDDAAALATIRAIASLDPADADAAKELARLERKRKEDLLKQLGAALASNDDVRVLSLLEQCEKLGITDAAEVTGALAVQHRVFADKAQREISQIIPTLAELQAGGLWQQCGEKATRVRSLVATYGFGLSPTDASAVAAATAYFESCRQEAMHKARFKEAVSAVSECADRIQSNEKSAAKNILEQLEDDRLQLKKCYEKAKEFALPISDALVSRVGQVAAALEAEIERLKRARKVRNILLATGAVVLFAALGTGAYFVLRAGQFTGELRGLITQNKALPLRQLVAEVEEKHSIYLSVPSLKTALLEAKSWLEGVSAQSDAAEKAMARAYALADGQFAGTTPEEASAVYQQAREAIDKLPVDLGDTLRPRLAEAEGKLTLWLGAMRDERVAKAKTLIEEAREMGGKVEAAGTGDELKAAVEPMTRAVATLLELSDSSVEQMQLPAALKAEISDLAAKVERSTDVLQAYESALDGLATAGTIEEYAKALEKLSEVQLPRSPMVKAAQHLATKKLEAHQILGSLILPGAPEVWASIKNPQDLDTAPQPTQTREAEVDRLRDLLNDKNLAGVYEATLQDRDGAVSSFNGRKIYIRGKLETSDEGGRYTRASGMVYDPSLSGGRLNFQQQAFVHTYSPATGAQSGKRVDGQKESDASTAMQQFGLKQLVNSDGSKYAQSILAAMDKVVAAREAPPLVKAYVLHELSKIAKSRPNAWGLAWVPALEADLAETRQLAGGNIDSGDWMVPAKAQAGEKLSGWFKRRGEFSYVSQQAANRALAKAALEAGLTVCGYVGPQGEYVETQKGISGNAKELWGLDAGSGTAAVLYAKEVDAPDAAFVPRRKGIILSPVFSMPVSPADAVKSALNSARVPEDLAPLYAGGFPPLFAPRKNASGPAPQ